jgi:hypothetical protein
LRAQSSKRGADEENSGPAPVGSAGPEKHKHPLDLGF